MSTQNPSLAPSTRSRKPRTNLLWVENDHVVVYKIGSTLESGLVDASTAGEAHEQQGRSIQKNYIARECTVLRPAKQDL
jgi:hypothetical protein